MDHKFERNRFKAAPTCPCTLQRHNKDGKFAPFEGEVEYGHCHSCNQTFYNPAETPEELKVFKSSKQEYIPRHQVEKTFINLHDDNLHKFFVQLFGQEGAASIAKSVSLGSCADGTIFWLINRRGMTCQPKIIPYTSDGHRGSQIKVHPNYTSAKGYYPCLFGEQFLDMYPEKTIGIVESEKTAAMCMVAFPELLWIATGGARGLTGDKASVMRKRNVMVFPDADEAGRAGAQESAEVLRGKQCKVEVKDLFEAVTDGYDLGDFISDYYSDQDSMKIMTEGIRSVEKKMLRGSAIDFAGSIFTFSSQKDYMLHTFRNGKKKGETTRFREIDPFFKWKPTFVNTWTGYPNSGKSELLLYLAMLKAKWDNKKWIIFPPENMSSNEEGMLTVDEIGDTLIHAYVGKTTDPHNPYQQQMTEKEYLDAINFINDHFLVVYPPGLVNPKELIEYYQFSIDDAQERFFGTITDPWNNLKENPRPGQLIDDYLIEQISMFKAFSVRNYLTSNIVVHPRNPPVGKDGDVPPANAFSLRGGAAFNNKSDAVLSVHRPDWFQEAIFPRDVNYVNASIDPITKQPNKAISGRNSTYVTFNSFKLKNQKLVGVLGAAEMHFDRAKNRYMHKNYDYMEVKYEPTDPSIKPINPVQKHEESEVELPF